MVSARTQATLLLTVRLDARATATLKPLDVAEWNRLARWLDDRQSAPEDLIQGDASVVLEEWNDPRIEQDRLFGLLDRGHSLAVKMERWLSTGLWVIGRSDADYPKRLKRRLGESAPPLLFGYGDHRQLQHGGVAIVGSRDAAIEDLVYAEELGAAVSQSGRTVVSGGARGIDDRAAQGAFRNQGTVIAVLSDSLIKSASKKAYRDHLLGGDLALLTPYSPEAGFSAGNAMGRNRLIYCLADVAVAVSSARNKGGTFSGASEALRRGWVPVWVKASDDSESGNQRLIDRFGARQLPDAAILDIDELIKAGETEKPVEHSTQQSLFDVAPAKEDNVVEARDDDSRKTSAR